MRGAGRRWAPWLLGAGLVLCAIPLLLGALAAFPATDDFVFVHRTHPTWAATRSLPHVLVDAWRYTAMKYRTWQGTFFGVLVMTLNPAVVTLTWYGVHAWVLLAAFGGALWALVRAAEEAFGLDRRQSAMAFCVLAAVSWVYMPDLKEGLYWFNGAWFYVGAHAAWMLALAVALRLPKYAARKRRWLCTLLWAICAALGLDNYVTAMLALCSLALLCAIRWPASRRDAFPVLIGIVLLAVGLAFSILAPGNAVRMSTETAYARPAPWVVHAALRSAGEAASLLWRFLMQTPLAALCVLAVPWLYGALGGDRQFRHPLAAAAYAFLGLCAMVFPHMYTAGGHGPARIVDLYFLYCTLAAPACTAYCVGALARPDKAADCERVQKQHAWAHVQRCWRRRCCAARRIPTFRSPATYCEAMYLPIGAKRWRGSMRWLPLSREATPW